MSSSKDNTNSHKRNSDTKYTLLTSILSVLFDQVRLQQEVRDRWFGHYLTIIGAISASATLALKIFESSIEKSVLYFVVRDE